MIIREYEKSDIPALRNIWNNVVDAGNAFPQEERLSDEQAEQFFAAQSFTAAAEDNGIIVGLYILHPNNVGRCGHIANASFAVHPDMRGKQIGRQLVTHCLYKCGELGFRILQFNAVVADNKAALALYEGLGFRQLGVIPGGFRKKDGSFADIIPHYFDVSELKRSSGSE